MRCTKGVLASRRAAGPTFSPLDLTDLKGWYDASDTATITDAGGGAVSQWDDKSGEGRHLTQATSARRPVTAATTLNSLNVLDFAGDDSIADQAGDAASYWTFLHGSNPAEVWLVLKPGVTSDPGVQMRLITTHTGASSRRGALLNYDDRAPTNNGLSAFVFTGSTFQTAINVSAANDPDIITANAWHLVEWVVYPGATPASDRNTFIIDQGTPSKTNASSTSPSALTAIQGLVVGGLTPSATTDGLIGSVAEIVVSGSALTSDERTGMRTYLTDKWGL